MYSVNLYKTPTNKMTLNEKKTCTMVNLEKLFQMWDLLTLICQGNKHSII